MPYAIGGQWALKVRLQSSYATAMIESFHIKNFRSCIDVSLDGIGQILALAGRNGAGKTNILEALDWLAKMATVAPWQYGVHVMDFEEKIEGKVVFGTAGKTYRYSAEAIAARPTAPDDFRFEIKEALHQVDHDRPILMRTGDQVRLARGEVIRIGAHAPSMPALLSLLPTDFDDRRELEDAFNFLSSVRYYPLDEPSHPGAPAITTGSGYTNWLAEYKTNPAASQSVPMRLLHLQLTSPESLNELREIVGDNGLSIIAEVLVDSFRLPQSQGAPTGTTPGEPETYHYVRFRPSNCRSGVDYNGLSLGTRRVLRIIASIILDQSAVMLVEQPEDSIHSGLMKKLIAFLRQYSARTQIIMASHSANVFNKMRPEEIRIVYLADGQTRVRALTQDELAEASRYVHDEGPLSEFIQVAIDDT